MSSCTYCLFQKLAADLCLWVADLWRDTSGQNQTIQMGGYIENQSTEDWKRYSTRGRAAFYDQQLLSYGSLSRTSSAIFWIKWKYKYKILKHFLSKNKFPQSPMQWLMICHKYCPKFRTCSKNFNFYTRQI